MRFCPLTPSLMRKYFGERMEFPMFDNEKESSEYREMYNWDFCQIRKKLAEWKKPSFFLSASTIQKSGGILKPAVGVQDFSLRIASDGEPRVYI